MGSQYAGDPEVFPADFTIPDDGDPTSASTVNVAFEALGDRTAFAWARLNVLPNHAALTAIAAPANGMMRFVAGHGHYVFDTSATTGFAPFRLAADDSTVGGWVAGSAHETTKVVIVPPANTALSMSGAWGSPTFPFAPTYPVSIEVFRYVNGSVYYTPINLFANEAYGISVPLDQSLVNGSTLTQVRFQWQGNAAHAALPGLMPSFCVARVDKESGVVLSLSSTTFLSDTSANAAAYDLRHWVTLTPDQFNAIDKSTYGYFAFCWGEGGTNARTMAALHSIELTMSVPDARLP